jgi:hypothetical protein
MINTASIVGLHAENANDGDRFLPAVRDAVAGQASQLSVQNLILSSPHCPMPQHDCRVVCTSLENAIVNWVPATRMFCGNLHLRFTAPLASAAAISHYESGSTVRTFSLRAVSWL